MMNIALPRNAAFEEELIDFYRSAIRVRSYSDEEGDVARLIEKKMKELDYDEVYIDRVGNVVGRVGNGPTVIHFDSHMDNVHVHDEADGSLRLSARRSLTAWFTAAAP